MTDDEHDDLLTALHKKARAHRKAGADHQAVVRWRDAEEELACIASDVKRMRLERELAALGGPVRAHTVEWYDWKLTAMKARTEDLLKIHTEALMQITSSGAAARRGIGAGVENMGEV